MDNILLFIPCYNCQKEIVKVLESLLSYSSYFTEVIVIDNCSTDNTFNNSKKWAENHPDFPVSLMKNKNNYNLGGSHKVAFNYAIDNNFDYLVVLHGDNQGDISDIKEILDNKIYKNYDCCLGARFMKGSKLVNYSPVRILGNICFNILFSICLLKILYDLGGGLNIYSVKMLKNKYWEKFPDALTFNYIMTMALDFYKQKYKFFPLTWKEEGQVSNVKVTSQAFDLLSKLFKYLASKERFIKSELRTNIIESYESETVYSNLSK
ncbi:glycosyltransferase family 2 protein [bacterium]|nr:glycosyltransferase family 2 protein [bacterium]